jgi:hypothetical protein
MILRRSEARVVISLLLTVTLLAASGCSCGSGTEDTQVVFWTGPVDNEEVWGIARLTVESSADEDVSSVKFYHDLVDNNHLIGTVTSAIDSDYTHVWYTTDVPNGEHVIYAVVDYENGEFVQESITVEVGNRKRLEAIPTDAVKITPDGEHKDDIPPILNQEFSDYWYDPVPLEGPINTAGGEDAAFITYDDDFYVCFVPDVSVEPKDQLLDRVTGIYWSTKVDGIWTEPERVLLNYYNDPALDGAQSILGNTMWFGSVRAGNYREVDLYIAEFQDGIWTNWENAGEQWNSLYDDGGYEVGEMHVTADGNQVYFHSDRPDGQGDRDIWVTEKVDGEWQEPENVEAVNTEGHESRPYVAEDGEELWFTRTYLGAPAVYRSLKVDGEWQEPELIISQFAAEPTLDSEGNIYFAHHFIKDNEMVEADIYVCYRR